MNCNTTHYRANSSSVPGDPTIRALLQQVERAVRDADVAAYIGLLATSANRTAAETFAFEQFKAGATRVAIQERERLTLAGTLPGDGYSLTVDAFTEYGDKARVLTWTIDVKRVGGDWRIAGQSSLSTVDNLYRLSVTPTKQYDAKNLVVVAEDFELTLAEGSVFIVEAGSDVTGLVMLGRGEMRFHPTPETEKGQARIFAGAETVESRFDAAYVRVGTLEQHLDLKLLVPRPVDPRDLKRAEQIFREESGKAFAVDLADLTHDTWSLLPGDNDFVAEVRTRRFDTLTYARSANEPEDISFFERKTRRNIAAYASKSKLESRGRFYNEDDLAAFDVLDYEIDVASSPERNWIDADVTMQLRVAAPSLGQLTLRLADSLVVRSVSSPQFGRLFSLRVANQNTLLINLPSFLLQDAEMTLKIAYSGRLEPQAAEREMVAVGQDPAQQSLPVIEDQFQPKAEPNYLYSNRSYWYPQSTVTDYATATIQLTIPAIYGTVASGEPAPNSPKLLPAADGLPARKVYVYNAERPIRYLAFIVAKLARVDERKIVFHQDAGENLADRGPLDLSDAVYNSITLTVDAHPKQVSKGKETAERATDILTFYESLIGDSPYSTFGLALIENTLPGGHSPGYFAVLNQPLPFTGVSWRNDPAAFSNYPDFFIAHEIAHQWWGQAVGWQNYHEQWLSEGFAQYFAALYAQKARGDDVFNGVMRQMRRWAIDQSDQGAIYLGYRIGHIKNDTRAYRAIIYNKGAVVLHMLRQLLGDEKFFAGLRRFYDHSRYLKVGTDDFRKAMEEEAGVSLEPFFEQWVYGAAVPTIGYRYRVETAGGKPVAVLHVEQTGPVFELPLVVTLQYSDRRPVDVVVPVRQASSDIRVPLEGALRGLEVSGDDTTAKVVRLP